MFSLKRSPGPNPTNIDPNTALPNNYGKIRTLKEDLENFESGKKESEEEILSNLPPAQAMPPVQKNPEMEKGAVSPSIPQAPLSAPKPIEANRPASPAFQPPQVNISEEKKEVPNPFGSDTYFSDKSPFEKLDKAPQSEVAGASPKKKLSGSVVIIISAVLVLAILGGGFYYYWFFMRKPTSTPAVTPAQTETPSTAEEETPSSKNVRALLIDPSAGNNAFQAAFQETASNFIAGASEGDLIEVRPVGKDNQQISASDFISVSLLNLPAGVTQKFYASDYSLFVKKENGEARAGMVMKLSDQTGLSEELLAQEKQLPSETSFLYLGQILPAAEPVFNLSKYKSADIRYYNFSSPKNTSLDYSVIKGTSGGYLIFATSKETVRSILDYMSEK